MPEKFGNSEMPPEEPGSPESKEELSQWQKELLDQAGLESIKDLEEQLEFAEENLKNLPEDSKEFQSFLDQKTYYEELLSQIKADHEPAPEEIESDIEKYSEQLKEYGEIFDKLDKETQDQWYEVEMGAEVAKDRKGARAKLEIFLEKLKKIKNGPDQRS